MSHLSIHPSILNYFIAGKLFSSQAACLHHVFVLSTSIVQSTLVISKLKGPSETLRDIHPSTYQIFRIEENTNRTTKFNK